MVLYNVLISLAFLLYIFICSWSLGRIFQVRFKFLSSNYYVTFLVGLIIYLFTNFFFCLWFNIGHAPSYILYYFLIALQCLIGLYIIFNWKLWFHTYYIASSFYIVITIIIGCFLYFYFVFFTFTFNSDPHFHFPYILYISSLQHNLGYFHNSYTGSNANSFIYLVQVFYVFLGMVVAATGLDLIFAINFALSFIFVTCLVLIITLIGKWIWSFNKYSAHSVYLFVGLMTSLALSLFAMFGYTPGEGNCWRMILIIFAIYLLAQVYYLVINNGFGLIFLGMLSYVSFSFSNSSFYLFLFLLIAYFFTLGFLKKDVKAAHVLLLSAALLFEFLLTLLLAAFNAWTIAVACVFVLIYGLAWGFYYFDISSWKAVHHIYKKHVLSIFLCCFFATVMVSLLFYLIVININVRLTVFVDNNINNYFSNWNFYSTVSDSPYGGLSTGLVLLIGILIMIGLAGELIIAITCTSFYQVKNQQKHPALFLATLNLLVILLFYNPFNSWIFYYCITFNSFHRIQNIVLVLSILTMFASIFTIKYKPANKPVKQLSTKRQQFLLGFHKVQRNRFLYHGCALIVFGLSSIATAVVYIIDVGNNDLNNNTSFFTKSPKGEQHLLKSLDLANPLNNYLILGDATNYYYFSYKAMVPYTRADLQQQNKNSAVYQGYLQFVNVNWTADGTSKLNSLGKLASKLSVQYIVKSSDKSKSSFVLGDYKFDHALSNSYFYVYDKQTLHL